MNKTTQDTVAEAPNFLEKNNGKRGKRLAQKANKKQKVYKQKVKGTITERPNNIDNQRYVGILSRTSTTQTRKIINDRKKEVLEKIVDQEIAEEIQNNED